MLFTPNQIEELLKIVEYHHVLFITENVGDDTLTSSDKRLLKDFGVDIEKVKVAHPKLSQAFKFGVLAEALGSQRARKVTYKDFKQYLKSGNFIPLTRAEELALEAIKRQAYSDIKGLGNKVGKDLQTVHIEVDQEKRLRMERQIEKTAEEAIENRKSVKQMALDLGKKTGDWTRDFGRISEYIMQSSYEEGRAASIKEKEGGDALVYKDVFPGACKHCIRLYLTEGIGSRPVVFKLSDLQANGNNIGRKVDEWKPVVAATHPWCRCTLNHVRSGYDWDPDTRAFTKLKDFERKVERKSKITITVGDNKFEI